MPAATGGPCICWGVIGQQAGAVLAQADVDDKTNKTT
jgi:hypothetical protein